nr:uncharacterized protein LOC118972704 [Manis javanica]
MDIKPRRTRAALPRRLDRRRPLPARSPACGLDPPPAIRSREHPPSPSRPGLPAGASGCGLGLGRPPPPLPARGRVSPLRRWPLRLGPPPSDGHRRPRRRPGRPAPPAAAQLLHAPRPTGMNPAAPFAPPRPAELPPALPECANHNGCGGWYLGPFAGNLSYAAHRGVLRTAAPSLIKKAGILQGAIQLSFTISSSSSQAWQPLIVKERRYLCNGDSWWCNTNPCSEREDQQIFGKELSTTLNADEAVTRGCALQCAILSPAFKVREFSITDVLPYPISLRWNSPAEEGSSDCEVFSKNHAAPFSKELTFYRKEPFTLEAYYSSPQDVPYPDPAIGK